MMHSGENLNQGFSKIDPTSDLFVDSLTGVLVDRLTSLSEPLDLLLVAFLLCLLYVLGVPDLERKELNMS